MASLREKVQNALTAVGTEAMFWVEVIGEWMQWDRNHSIETRKRDNELERRRAAYHQTETR